VKLAKEDVEAAHVHMVACERALVELAEKTRVQMSHAQASRARQAEWLAKVAKAREASVGDTGGNGPHRAVPIFPVGDALLEPFWCVGRSRSRPASGAAAFRSQPPEAPT
jgi:hypothetical protein